METSQLSKCDLCGKIGDHREYVNVKDLRGMFCTTCRSMIEQTTRDDGSSRLHPTHKRMLQDQIRFNQNCKVQLLESNPYSRTHVGYYKTVTMLGEEFAHVGVN